MAELKAAPKSVRTLTVWSIPERVPHIYAVFHNFMDVRLGYIRKAHGDANCHQTQTDLSVFAVRQGQDVKMPNITE